MIPRDYCPETGYETHREDEAPQNLDTCPDCGTDHLPGLPCPDECRACGMPLDGCKCEDRKHYDLSSLEGIDPRSPLFGVAVAHLICKRQP